MENNKIWITLGIVVLIVAIKIGIRITQVEKEEEVIKIGAILPFIVLFYKNSLKKDK